MASLVAENWAYSVNGNDNSDDRAEGSKFDTAFLMSLLEESNGEEFNDEQLNRVIQSLEAEIKEQNMVEGCDLSMEPELLFDEEDGQNCLKSMDFRWADNMEMVPSSPSEDMNWCNYMEYDMVEFENIGDYSDIYKVASSLENEEHGFSSLWLETYDKAAYN